MTSGSLSRAVAAALAAASIVTAADAAIGRQEPSPVGVASGRVTIEGTSNIHDYTATTSALRVKTATLAVDAANPEFLAEIVKPGALQNVEIAIPAKTLASGKDGLDKNMHKALKTQEHPDITFRLNRLQPAADGAVRAIGVLRIAGVERDVAFDLTAQLNGSVLSVKGSVPLLMTDYGIAPPKAMLGMLKTDPRVVVKFDTSFTIPPAHLAGTS
jgi:polyisoprenoid-binding protein YceI